MKKKKIYRTKRKGKDETEMKIEGKMRKEQLTKQKTPRKKETNSIRRTFFSVSVNHDQRKKNINKWKN